MKRNLKMSMLVLVLLLAVGFAAVSTTLVINGTANFGTNDADFDVIFTKSVIDGVNVSDTTISKDGKSITFTTNELAKAGDKSTLNFVVTNNSTQYDANVTMECKADGENNEYYTITNTIPSVISAKTNENGTVTATLKKVSTEAITETFTCTIEASAVEKTTAGTEKVVALSYDGDSDKVADVGDMIKVGTEEFYVISNDGANIRMLAQYNLQVGECKTLDFKPAQDTYAVTSCVFMLWNNGLQMSHIDINIDNYNGDFKGVVKYNEITTYLENYSNLLSTNYNVANTASLITEQDLESLNCSSDSMTCKTSEYTWVYSRPYWTSMEYDDQNMVTISKDGTYKPYLIEAGTGLEAYFDSYNGVRPVITISTDVL